MTSIVSKTKMPALNHRKHNSKNKQKWPRKKNMEEDSCLFAIEETNIPILRCA